MMTSRRQNYCLLQMIPKTKLLNLVLSKIRCTDMRMANCLILRGRALVYFLAPLISE